MKATVVFFTLLSCVLCARIATPNDRIIVKRPDGEVITSYSVRQYTDQHSLNCSLAGGANARWSMAPPSKDIRMNTNGVIVISTNSLLPKTTFTITATVEEEKTTLEFDIEIHDCEYGEFMYMTIESGGILELYRDAELVLNETIRQKYYCLPVATYDYRVIKNSMDYAGYFVITGANRTHYHTGFIARGVGEGSFSNDPDAKPILSFPSVLSILPGSRKKMLLSTHGPIDRVVIEPEVQFDSSSFTLTLNAPEAAITVYTITAFRGDTSVNATLSLHTETCPEGYSRIVVEPQFVINEYALPEVDSPLFYSDRQSFCVNRDAFRVNFITGNSQLLLYFLEDGQPFFHYYSPTSQPNQVLSFTVHYQKPVAFASPIAFSTDAPVNDWMAVSFDDSAWKKGSEGGWGAAASAWFRASFPMAKGSSYGFLLLRGAGSATVFVNGNAFSRATLTEMGTSIVIPASFLSEHNVIAVSLVKATADAIRFGLSVRLSNSPTMQVMDGEASAVQPNPDPANPPSNAFFIGNTMNHFWGTDAVPAELIFTFHNDTQQVVNALRMVRGPAPKPFALQVVGVTGEERVPLAFFNRDSIAQSYSFLQFTNTRAFSAYHFVFTATNLTEPIKIHSALLYNRPIYTCPKKYGVKGAVDGTTLYKRCPLGSTGRKQLSCVHENDSTFWSESREQCYPTNPAKEYEFLDWTFTVRGMTREAWQDGSRMTEMLAEETYMRGRDVTYPYVDFAVDGETTVMTVFSRCVLEKGLGAVITRNLERLEPRFSELVSQWMKTECTAAIESVRVRHYVNWPVVISVSVVVVVVITLVAVYLSFRNKKGDVKHLKKGINAKTDANASLLV